MSYQESRINIITNRTLAEEAESVQTKEQALSVISKFHELVKIINSSLKHTLPIYSHFHSLVIGRYHSSKITTETNIGTNRAELLSSYLTQKSCLYCLELFI